MTGLQTHRDLCRQFAALFSYPATNMRGTAADCLDLLWSSRPEAAEHLQPFCAFLTSNGQERIEEVFTGTFDLQPLCHPYVGYQLCGESQQRTLFLIRLQEIFRQHDYQVKSELPDHLSEMLRFIGITDDLGCRRELIDDGLLPALEKLIDGIDNPGHPYTSLLRALHCFLSPAGTDKGAFS